MPKNRHRRRKPLIPGLSWLLLLGIALALTMGWFWALARSTTFERPGPTSATSEEKA